MVACGRGTGKSRSATLASTSSISDRRNSAIVAAEFLPQDKGCSWKSSGGNPCAILPWLTQYIATPPHRLDVIPAVRCIGELLAQLADEHVDDLEFRLIHAAVEVVEKHL